MTRDTLKRRWPTALAGVVGIIVLVGLAWQAGGYFPPAYLAAGTVVYATLAVIILLRPPHHALSTEARVGLTALAALAIWSGISTTWSPSPDTGVEVMQRNFVYLGLFGLGLLAAGSRRLVRPFVWGLCAVIAVVVGAGLLSRLYPEVVSSPPGPLVSRLAYPVSYWNALGALAAMGVTLTASIAADIRLRTVVRSAAAGVSVMLVTGLYLTLSRGALLALFIGTIVVVALFPQRWSLILSIFAISVVAALAIVRLGHYHVLVDPPKRGESGQASAGARYGPQLLLFMALAGLAQVGIAAAQGSREASAAAHKYAIPVLICLPGLLGICILVVSVFNQSWARGWTSKTNHYVERQWNGLLSPTQTFEKAEGTARLTTAQGDRLEAWRVAANAFKAHPVGGDGAGSYEVRWVRERREDAELRNAHSLYLETLGELGLVGFVLLAIFVGSLVAAVIRARRRRGALDTLGAGVFAACFAWLFHAGIDWDWQVTALSGLAIMLSATLYPRGRKKVRRDSGGE